MRILILQLKRIGDAILTTPLISAIRTHHPEADITLALDASTASLAPALGADRVTLFRRGVAGWSFWRDIAAGQFDICFDVTGNDRSAAATALSRAKRRVTWSRIARKPLRRAVFTDFVESSVKTRHTADHHTDLLRALDISVENVPLQLFLPAPAREEARQALTEARVSSPFAVVHAGTARPEKYWLPERWASVIEALQNELALPVVLTGSADADEQRHLEIIRQTVPCTDLSGSLSLLGTAAVLAKARVLCAVDSAPVHLADALATPLVALFGPTNPFHWRPRNAHSRIVTASQGELKPDFPKSPMSDIAPEAVVEAARSLVNNR